MTSVISKDVFGLLGGKKNITLKDTDSVRTTISLLEEIFNELVAIRYLLPEYDADNIKICAQIEEIAIKVYTLSKAYHSTMLKSAIKELPFSIKKIMVKSSSYLTRKIKNIKAACEDEDSLREKYFECLKVNVIDVSDIFMKYGVNPRKLSGDLEKLVGYASQLDILANSRRGSEDTVVTKGDITSILETLTETKDGKVNGYITTSLNSTTKKALKPYLVHITHDKMVMKKTKIRGLFKPSLATKKVLEADLCSCNVTRKKNEVYVTSGVKPIFSKKKKLKNQWRVVLLFDTETEATAWTEAIRKNASISFQLIKSAQNDDGTPDNSGIELLNRLYECAENRECHNCKAPYPFFANIRLRKMLCIDCAGINRDQSIKSVLMDRKCWNENLIKQFLVEN